MPPGCQGLLVVQEYFCNRQTQGQPRVSREQSKHYSLILGQWGSYKKGGHGDISLFSCSPTDNRMKVLVLAALLTGRRVPPAPPLPELRSLSSAMGPTGHKAGQTWSLFQGSPWGLRGPILGSPQIPPRSWHPFNLQV